MQVTDLVKGMTDKHPSKPYLFESHNHLINSLRIMTLNGNTATTLQHLRTLSTTSRLMLISKWFGNWHTEPHVQKAGLQPMAITRGRKNYMNSKFVCA